MLMYLKLDLYLVCSGMDHQACFPIFVCFSVTNSAGK